MKTPYPAPAFSRRDWLKSASCGFGYMAMAALANEAAAEYQNPLASKSPHFKARAKRVIFMFMRGGPSQVDTFDYKPQLTVDHGKTASEKGGGNGGGRTLLKSPWEFKQYGESGLWISDLFPQLAKHADDLCLLNSMHADSSNHPPAMLQMHTGTFQFVRPSLGAWVLYGLGTENQNLPGFITISPNPRYGGALNYGSSFLPAAYQGTRIGGDGVRVAEAKIDHIASALGAGNLQRQQLDLLQTMNRDLARQDEQDQQLQGVIESYELAFRMQSEVPKIMDLSRETQATLDMYGLGGNGKKPKPTDDFGRQCLLARRFAEAGVRFIEISHDGWDQHADLFGKHGSNAAATDQPIAALLTDLKQRGLLDDTLVLWGGEFGRTPGAKKEDSRDHNAAGFSMWAAGGGVKGGLRYGATDEHGMAAVENRMHVHDLHATILALLGLDHTRLTYRYSGRDFRLTDVHGNVATEIMA